MNEKVIQMPSQQSGRGTENMRRRRARILSAAREMLMAGGPEGVAMRDLADQAEVSVPTLYNIFGSKNGLIAAALQELHAVATQRIRTTDGARGFERLTGMIRNFRHEMEEIPVFARSTFRLYVTHEEPSDYRQFTNMDFANSYAMCLQEMRNLRELDARVDILHLAGRINHAVMSNAVEWAFDRISLSEFEKLAVTDAAYMLVGLASGGSLESIEGALGFSGKA